MPDDLAPESTEQVVVEETKDKPGYTIAECIDCGRRKKVYKDWQCEECYVRLSRKKEELRKRIMRQHEQDNRSRRRAR